MEVRDAETGEWLVLASPMTKPQKKQERVDVASPSRTKPTERVPLPLLASSPSRKTPLLQHEASNNVENERLGIFPETQSTRPMGTTVDWQKDQQARVQRAENRFQTSLRCLRAELQRKDIDRETRQVTEVQILEKMKVQYATQIRMMIVEEMEREVAREVEARLELSVIGKERLRKKHERDRTFYKSQIERMRAECELSLASSMAQFNLLR